MFPFSGSSGSSSPSKREREVTRTSSPLSMTSKTTNLNKAISSTTTRLWTALVLSLSVSVFHILMDLQQYNAKTSATSSILELYAFLPSFSGKYNEDEEVSWPSSRSLTDNYNATTTTSATTTAKVHYQPNDIVYMAYYYPWYRTSDFNTRHGPLRFVPQMGLYDTSNPSVVEQHIDWMVDEASIDGLLVSWDESNVVLTKHLEVGFLKARNLNKLRNGWCILYESKESLGGKPNFARAATFDKLVSDMQLLEDRYFGLDSYWKVDGDRPVVILYLTRAWKNWTPSMMAALQNAMKHNVLFIADEPYTGGSQRFLDLARHGRLGDPEGEGAKFEGAVQDMWFEAYTSYNAYEPTFIQPNDTAASYMLREGMDVYRRWASETYMIPHVLPKYHDFREGNPDLPGTTEGLWEQLEQFTCLSRSTTQTPVGLAKRMPRYTFVTSWNEWWEGTQIEPDVYGTSGFQWMATLKKFKESNYTCPPAPPPTQQPTMDIEQQ